MELLKPSSRYSIRLYVLVSLAAIFLIGAGSILAWVLSLNWVHAVHVNRILQIYIFLVLLAYVLLLSFARHYYQSIAYELRPDEIELQRGVWVHCIQRIPLRSIAGVTVKRDFIDRCLEIGTLEFMLPGTVSNKISAARMVGLTDVDTQYGKILDLLLQYWRKTRLQPDTGSVESHVLLTNSAIDLQ